MRRIISAACSPVGSPPARLIMLTAEPSAPVEEGGEREIALEIVSASRADKEWTPEFTLGTKGGALVTGDAGVTTRDSTDPVILRLAYDSWGGGVGESSVRGQGPRC